MARDADPARSAAAARRGLIAGALLASALTASACATAAEERARPDGNAPVADATSVRPTPLADAYRSTADAIIHAALHEGRAYDRLRHLCDVIGPRLSGSANLEEAVRWTADTFREDGMDRVVAEMVKVPHWVRGEESADLLEPRFDRLSMLGLGNSVGTPGDGVTADVLVVRDFDELARREAEVEGKIVLFDAPMPPYDPERGAGYGQTVTYRTNGASRAAKLGAVGVLVRSVTARSLSTPHTGMLRYDPEAPQIPAAALSVEDSEMLARLAGAGQRIRLRLRMQAHFEQDADSANVVGELKGIDRPDEYVVIGGHLDSWDVGQGAHDDGGACMAALDALRLLKSLGLRPRRTIRVVLFTNEENGLRGATAYVREHSGDMAGTVAAIEADSGVYAPLGFTHAKPDDERTERIRARLVDIASLLAPLGADRIRDGGGGADIGPMQAFGIPLLGLEVEGSRYFDIHHTEADTFDKVDKDDLHRCEAVLAIMAYVLADLPDDLRE